MGMPAALQYVVPAPGDYVLIAGGSLSALGRATSGDYELLIGLNACRLRRMRRLCRSGRPSRNRCLSRRGASASVEEASGSLTAAAPAASLKLADIDAGNTLTAYAEATSGNLIPALILCATTAARRSRPAT